MQNNSVSENIVSVLPIGPFNSSFSYISKSKVRLGDVVEIPFGRRNIFGMVSKGTIKNDIELKNIKTVFDFNIDSEYRSFIDWMSAYTLIPRGYILKMILSEKSLFKKTATPKIEQKFDFHEIELNANQITARDAILSSKNKAFLLHGVTGSGKTEIYLSITQNLIKQSKQVLIMLPEIMLSKQISDRVQKYFGCKPFLWNSNISHKNKRQIFQKAISGDPMIVIGTRSALFIPFSNLGLIIVDEEHDSSYKQEDMGSYNARDMAIVLSNLKKIPIILSTATPSLETYVNAKNKKYGYTFVGNRFGKSRLAEINLIDMRQCKFEGFISPLLLEEIQKTASRGEQSLIYLNRRGYSPITLCKFCGEKIACPNCTSWLVYHKKIDAMICHYCGHKILLPQICNFCGKRDSYIQFGPGVERVFEELSAKLPNLRMEIASSDTISSDTDISEFLEKIHKGELDIIIGTQILAKGHHFPNITLVGVVDGDLGINSADLRASEKMYQLINQVSGRAGRAEKQGRIFIQTFNPDYSLFKTLKSGKEREFLEMEIASRQQNKQPPFTRLASIIISGTNEKLTEEVTEQIAAILIKNIHISVFGPSPAPLFRLKGRIRWRILIKSLKKYKLSLFIAKLMSSLKIPKNIRVQIDIDPVTFF